MHESIRLGRIFGIPVGVNWSVLGIAVLIAWTLAVSALPDMVPGQTTAAYWITATIAAVAFFASLLTHEMAHALVARRNGVGISGITLWLLGGVSKLEGEPSSAGAEFRIAVVGPLTSLGLAGLFFVLAGGAAGLALPDLVVGTLAWLVGHQSHAGACSTCCPPTRSTVGGCCGRWCGSATPIAWPPPAWWPG